MVIINTLIRSGYKTELQLCPDGAPIKKKMVYASSASAIKQCLGTAKILQFQVSRVFVLKTEAFSVLCLATGPVI